jgi:hypothetical protein
MTPPDRGQIRCVTTRGADVISKLGWGGRVQGGPRNAGYRPTEGPTDRARMEPVAPSRGGSTTRGTVAGVAPDEQGAWIEVRLGPGRDARGRNVRERRTDPPRVKFLPTTDRSIPAVWSPGATLTHTPEATPMRPERHPVCQRNGEAHAGQPGGRPCQLLWHQPHDPNVRTRLHALRFGLPRRAPRPPGRRPAI